MSNPEFSSSSSLRGPLLRHPGRGSGQNVVDAVVKASCGQRTVGSIA
jgi:hypothetical protein